MKITPQTASPGQASPGERGVRPAPGPDRRFRVLALATHPVQYMAPLFRRMAREPAFDFEVAYCGLRGAQAAYDPEFASSVQWDVPLLDGYRWTEVPNRGSGRESFRGLYNPGLRGLIAGGRFDAVLCYVGYLRRSFWIAQRAARASGAVFLFGTDAHTLAPRDKKAWKAGLKQVVWPWLFRRADQLLVPSSATREMLRGLGLPEERITLTPYAVDNAWWKAESAKLDREEQRARLGAKPGQPVVLFCAKLQPWKRPMDLLQAFAEAQVRDSLLVFAGEGPERGGLEAEARRMGVGERVAFRGFVNQSELPALYTAADLLVLPSEYEPFAVVVNEAMCCGCPVVASDQVGAARDLVAPVRPEFVFPARDVGALARALRAAFADRRRLEETGRKSFEQVETHAPEKTIAATVEAVRQAVLRARS
jgi:glycosyltransferase involved in cell wall biosynthesis